nr:hypothetical protein [Colletotrichum gloeosporioides polymycovirus virus 1]
MANEVINGAEVGPGVTMVRLGRDEMESVLSDFMRAHILDPRFSLSFCIAVYNVTQYPEGYEVADKGNSFGRIVIVADYEWRGLEKDLAIGVWFPDLKAFCLVDLHPVLSDPPDPRPNCWVDVLTGVAGQGVIATALLGASARLLQDRYLHKSPDKFSCRYEDDSKLPGVQFGGRNVAYNRMAHGLAVPATAEDGGSVLYPDYASSEESE